MHPEFAPVAFISAIFILVVLPWHWRAGNVATLAIAFWLFISNIIYGVDALVWGNNVDIIIPVWCDITSKLIIGTNIALPLACLCICIHLEQVASVRLATTSIMDKRRRQIFEVLMCFLVPVFFMGLHFVVQGHRFDIIEEYGCRPTTYFSIPALFIVWLPPLVVSIIALVFAGLALRHFMLRRISFAAHLNAANSALTTSRYLRLMLMAALQMVWSLTITAYALWFTIIAVPIRPWTTWADVHSDFSRIDLYPTAFTPEIIVTGYYVLWWMVPISTIIYVAFFAFGRDAVDEYKKCFLWFRRRVLRQAISDDSKKGSFVSMPKTRSTTGGFLRKFVTLPTTTTSATSSLPPYSGTAPSSLCKSKTNLDDFHYDSQSDITCSSPNLPFTYPKAIGSLTDLSSPPTPSTFTTSTSRTRVNVFDPVPLTPYSPPTSLPPPPRHPRVQSIAENHIPNSS